MTSSAALTPKTGSDIALDTNQAVALLNGTGTIGAWVAAFTTIYLPVPVIGELYFGAENSTRVIENRARVAKLRSRTVPLPVSERTAEVYARVRVELRRLGRPIPGNDLWIAAVCLEHDLTLATLDAHFAVVPGLKVTHP